MRFDEVREALRPLRVNVSRTHFGNEVRVSLVGSRPSQGYFTDDLADALATGRAMAAERDRQAADLQPIGPVVRRIAIRAGAE